MTIAQRLAVGITTRNRPAALAACLASLERAADLISEIIVFDDGSEPPAETSGAAGKARFLRDAAAPGYIVGRNRMLASARAAFVLLLDDDTRLIDRASVAAALDVMRSDASIAAVGFAQANADGRPWPAAMQPALADYRCFVPSFIGFAHLLRRDVFLAVGGYRASFRFYGEEKEFCLRLIDAGYSVAYLPDARVAHLPDPAGRDNGRYLRYVVRNDCLNALYNDPIWRVIWVLPARLALYFRMRRDWRVADRGGLAWILREIARALPGVLRERRPVSRATLREWKRLRLSCPPIAAPEAERAG